MNVELSANWELSTTHKVSNYESPLLVNRVTGASYGPTDVVLPDSNGSVMLAATFVAARSSGLSTEGKALARAFCRQWAEVSS